MKTVDTPFAAKRVQDLSVAIARHVFIHSHAGIVFVNEPIALDEAGRLGLAPIILYGVSVPGTPVYWLTFALQSDPLPICTVLEDAWRTAEELRGMPEVVRVNRHLAKASPGLAAILSAVGVKIDIVAGADRQFSAALRTAQNNVRELGWFAKDCPLIKTIIDLREHAKRRFQADIEFLHLYHPDRKGRDAVAALLAQPMHPFEGALPSIPDWSTGSWLSSWESNLPPPSARYMEQSDSAMWLFTGAAAAGDGNDDDYYGGGSEWQDDAPNKAKVIVDCWPNSPAAVAKSIGATLKELKWFLAGRGEFAEPQRSALLTLLGIDLNPQYNEHEANGPCVLVSTNLRATVAAYEELTAGGDVDFSVEPLPKKGGADPSWRYILLRSCGGSLNFIMVPRGSVIAERLTEKSFINFEGVVEVSSSLYRDIVATCAKACTDPRKNVQVAGEFERRNDAHLDVIEEAHRIK